MSIQTSNYYVGGLKQFCTWKVKERRATENPVAHLSRMNARADRRVIRRALMADEARRLLGAARNGDTFLGMTGLERGMLYRAAMETGLRWNELRSLTRASFNLDADSPTVKVAAAYSKRRREDELPLRRDTADLLKDYLAARLPAAPAFPMPASDKGAKMVKHDLSATGEPDLNAVPYEDETGRIVDFHALRHSFITSLSAAGVHPKTAQVLARHSDINLTLSRYTHLEIADQTGAVEALPDLSVEAVGCAAIGTDGKSVLASCLAFQGGKRGNRRDESGQKVAVRCGGANKRKGAKTQAKASISTPDQLVRPEGFEPTTRGLRIRCSARLS